MLCGCLFNRTIVRIINLPFYLITADCDILPDTESYTSPQDRVMWTVLQGPGYSCDRDEVTVGRVRAVTCDTIPYSDAKCSDMRYACHLPVSVCDADLTERDGYERDVTDHLKMEIVFNDAGDRSGQYIEQSVAPLQDITSISSSRLDSEGRADHEGRGSAGCAYRSGPASHDADLERILRYAGEPPCVGAGSNIEYVAEVRDISHKPDEMVRPLTPEYVLLSIRSPAPSSLSSRAADRVWYPDHLHDDGLNGVVRTEGQSDTVICTERYLLSHVHACMHSHLHSRIRVHIYADIHVHVHAHIHAHIYAHLHVHVPEHIHAHIHPHIHPHIHSHIHALIHLYIHAHIPAHVHEHIHAYTCRHIKMHTCIRTYIHISEIKITPSPYHLTGVELTES